MTSLTNKQILLGVTGGIAAYKSAELVRLLQTAGAQVRVVMTKAAQEFITPLTLQALSGHPVSTDLLNPEAEAAMGHIELARWADCIVVAPATANCLSNLAAGSGSDLLSTLCLARRGLLALAPAMNQAMWHNGATQENLGILRDRNIVIMGPDEGLQACGDVGVGRMLAPEMIVEQVAALFAHTHLAGKKVVITAGPTREAIDPVRYLSNHSSGKMGYALADAAAEAGARTVLISGPTQLQAPDRVRCVQVISAQEMFDAVMLEIGDADVFIGAAAVADFRPVQKNDQKIKKSADSTMTIVLEKNPDIVATVAQQRPRPFTVGFAAETQHIEQYAKAKLMKKNLDMIVANDVSDSNIGFNSEDNAVTIFYGDQSKYLDRRNKNQLARDIVKMVAEQYK